MAVTADAAYDLNAAVAADVEPAVAAATGLRLVGFNARESDGTPAVATAQIVHGATVSGGDAVIQIELAANESSFQWLGEIGIPMASGISIDHVAGTFDLTLFTRTLS